MARKYVFFVYSNITIHLVKYYIKVNELDSSNIIIFYTRVGLTDVQELPGKKYEFLETFYIRFVNRHKSILKVFYRIWFSVYKIKTFIDNEIKENYNLFIPHLYWDTLQLLATNRKCKKVIYIEEGDLSYANEVELNQKLLKITKEDKFRRQFLSLNKLLDEHPFPKLNKDEAGICLNEAAFPFNYIKKQIYSFDEVFKNDSYQFFENFDDSTIILLEYLHSQTEIELNAYFSKFKEVLNLVKANFGSKIFLKPHPELLKREEKLNIFINIISEYGFEYKIINDPIELIIVNFKGVKIFCHSSSLIRYCCYAGLKPFVWGMGLISSVQREQNAIAYKFLEQYPELINFID